MQTAIHFRTYLGINMSLNCFQIRVLCTIWDYYTFVIFIKMTELSTILSNCLRKMSACLPLLHKAMKKWGLLWFNYVDVACYDTNANVWCIQMKMLVRSSQVIKMIGKYYEGFWRNCRSYRFIVKVDLSVLLYMIRYYEPVFSVMLCKARIISK